ncbi:heat shock protein 70 kDa 12B [Ceratobasidium sp. AG-Ba]|nr:heat shock protein 70 kDa 12B [Ceratobasidium sp. AG-Ba]QRW06781.1 heat shock protein 70 kDa 12B [Ceratobasidium sp. AG-Ba]
MESNEASGAPRSVWERENKIAISIDVGVRDTAVAFTYLKEGTEKAIWRITSWPGQELPTSQSTIPTAICYDTNNKPVAFGAEAYSPETEDMIENNQWSLFKHFALYLYPSDIRGQRNSCLDPLPSGLSLNQIYSDFFGYLLKHTKKTFEDRILDGSDLWQNLSPTMDVIITHPEVWRAREQSFLRSAAVQAGFADEREASKRIIFVPEADASFHFIMSHTNLGRNLKPSDSLLICDAGESTVTIATYAVKKILPSIEFEERCAPSSIQAGSARVSHEAKRYLEKALGQSDFSPLDIIEYINVGLQNFEYFARGAFRDPSNELTIQLARPRVNDSKLRIRRGRMTIPGPMMESFFTACVEEIISSVSSQLAEYVSPTHYIILFGSFGDSPYLRERFKARFATSTCQIVIINDSTKAVADGALMWYFADSDIRGESPRSIVVQAAAPSEGGSTLDSHLTPPHVASDISHSAGESQGNNPISSHGIGTHHCRSHGYSIELGEEKNVNQGELRRQLRNLNRQVEDIGRAISDYLAELGKPGDTTKGSHDKSALKTMFGHTSGTACLVESSSGAGMPTIEFFE